MGIFSLLVVIGTVLAAVAGFFIYLGHRSSVLTSSEEGIEMAEVRETEPAGASA